jgi:uncharacterized membrane protein YhiD involved in acid resistance
MTFLDDVGVDAAMLRQVAVAILVAYVLGQAIAWVYAWVRRPYTSRSFVQALIVGGIVGSMLILAIGNSLARGVGIVGALSLIRFRTNLRDPLDMVFIFASFAAGIAAGAGNVATAAVGTAVFLAVVSSLKIATGAEGGVEAELRVRSTALDAEPAVRAALRTHAASFSLSRRREAGVEKDDVRHVYRVVLRRADDESELVRAVSQIAGVTDVALALESTQQGDADDD